MGLTDAFLGRLPMIQTVGPKPARFADSKKPDWRICNYDSCTRSTSEFDSLAAQAGKEISTNNPAVLRSFRKGDMGTAGITNIFWLSNLHGYVLKSSVKWWLSSPGKGLDRKDLLQSLRKSTSGPTAKCSPRNENAKQ